MRVFATAMILFSFLQDGKTQVLFNESFNTAIPLPVGWAQQNLSSPIGIQPGWFQGNGGVFPANSGAPTAYIAANFQNGAGTATLSNWLFTPNVTLKDGDLFQFYTRGTGSAFPDRLQVRMSANGASVNVGATATSVGDFTNLLLDINPTYTVSGFPDTWTQFTVTVSGLGGVPTSGRIAFRYFVENGGPNGANSDYMGIDDVMYTSFAGPCAGAPTPGNTVSSSPAVCANTNFTLSLQNNPFVSGLTYQWQSSPTGIPGSFTNIPGATAMTLVTQQTAATFYQAVVSCGASSTASTPLQVNMGAASACYCPAGADLTILEKISNVTLNTINNTSTSTAGYENFTAISTTLEPGFPYPMSVSISQVWAQDQIIVWIDYNQNGSFADAGETVYSSVPPLAAGQTTVTTTLFVPFTATAGNTRMRVRLHDSSDGPNSTSCGNATWGQVEDYTVNILPVLPCAGTPAPGNTLSNAAGNTICGGVNFTLSLQNFTSGSGVTYQWQSSPSGAAGTYTNIPGATGVQYTTTQTASTYYQAIVTCGANAGTSTPLQVLLTPFTGCYCTSSANSAADEDILRVTVGTLNNVSTCTSVGPGPGSIQNRYSNYRSGTGAPAAPNLIQGASMPMQVQVGTCGGNFTSSVAVFIDFNQDGVFSSPAERAMISASGINGPHIVSGNLVIPANAVLGVTGMRVVNVETGTPTAIQPCGTYGWGETEDYLVNIVPCVQGTITAQPASATIGCSGNATFTVAATGSLLTFTWEYRTSSTGPWLLVPNAPPYSGLGTATLSITNAPSTLNGYQYRAVMSGPCTAPDVTSVATLTIGPLVATVNPPNANVCVGTITQLSITNTAPPSTTVFPSATPLNIVIPDVIGPPASPAAVADAGINHTIPVSIPAGSIIANMRVRFNISHSYSSDLLIVLRAPNGNILNLVYHRSATGTPGANYTNVVISSAPGLPLISTGAAPGYTGVYRPDAVTGAGPFGDPSGSGPTGFAPNVNTFTGLYSTPNGNWTIAIADPSTWGGDIGTLVNWSLEFDYGAPSTGIFSGGPGIFTDPAATIPYDGTTPISTVYVNPTVSTTYTLVVTNPLCVSGPTSIPITVSNPINNSATLNARDSVCENGTKTLVASAGQGNIQTTVWQVSTDGGTTWANVTNAGIYSGATTPSLTLTGTPLTANNNQYRAIISNPCGADTTQADILTVHPKPVVTLTPQQSQLLPGLTTTLTATSTTPVDTYTWYLNGFVVPNASGSSLIVNIDGLGDYHVDVLDIYGCTSSSNTVNVSDSASDIVFIYPSPNTGQFQIRFRSQQGNTNLARMVNIYDSKGSRIYSRSYPINIPYERLDVDLRNHGKGVYMVELADRNGARIKAGRVVIL